MRRIAILALVVIQLLALGAWAEALPGSNAGNSTVNRTRAEEIVQAAYPGCLILFAQDEGENKRLGIVAEDFCGSILVSGEGILSSSIKEDAMIREGMLTMTGALETMRLYRPEAEFRALELDEDDGLMLYEGEALLANEVYEFELDAVSGKLLEWERDD